MKKLLPLLSCLLFIGCGEKSASGVSNKTVPDDEVGGGLPEAANPLSEEGKLPSQDFFHLVADLEKESAKFKKLWIENDWHEDDVAAILLTAGGAHKLSVSLGLLSLHRASAEKHSGDHSDYWKAHSHVQTLLDESRQGILNGMKQVKSEVLKVELLELIKVMEMAIEVLQSSKSAGQ